ncbi:MAG TPA: hypothetical protein PKH24_15630 [Sedimentisphaerales bacterium]|jgi:chromosome segregation ATPase|nr:hypothetical protein [Sedimentisphaerales bacterium]HNU30495.1 hypothetical protein [Sedimentisphaerales bacterium]
MNRWFMIVGIGAAICLLAGGGCNGSAKEQAESNAQIKQLRTALDKSQREKTDLQGDVTKLQASLKNAESGLADSRKAEEDLRKQVEGLTTARTGLEARVSDLDKARGDLAAKVEQLTASGGQLQQRVEELVKSRDDLQKMVSGLIDTRGTLEKQVAALTKARNAAIQDARTAQSKVDLLSDRLKAQTQQMIELQEQIKSVRSVLDQLQQKLE